MLTCPPLSTTLQLRATHDCPLPATLYGVAAAQALHPLVPPLDVPVYPSSHTEHAASLVPAVPDPTVVYPATLQAAQPALVPLALPVDE